MDRRTILGAGLACLGAAPAASQALAPPGVPRRAFVGRLLTEWLTGSDGMRLLEPFAYVDASGRPWIVPDGAEVTSATLDGAPVEYDVRSTARGEEVVVEAPSGTGTNRLVVTYG